MSHYSDSPAVEIRNLYVSLGNNLVLEDINLQVRHGEFLGIIGPNGGGKSTLLRSILGLVPPDRGTIRIMGGSVKEHGCRVGYVPQYLAFDRAFPIKVSDVVLMGRLGTRRGRWYSQKDREVACQALKRVEMERMGERLIGELSGGERQRILVARALAVEPGILLLDEPTASVDPGFQTTFYELVAELNQTMTVLMVSHDITAVSRYVKKIACLNRRLYYENSREISAAMVEEMYHCPVDLIAHGIPHRVLPFHEGVAGE